MNVYDFDNTIYDGETLVDFILYYVRTDPRIWRYVPKLLVIAFKDAFHLPKRWRLMHPSWKDIMLR